MEANCGNIFTTTSEMTPVGFKKKGQNTGR